MARQEAQSLHTAHPRGGVGMTTGTASSLASLAGSHLLSVADLDRQQILAIVENAIALKSSPPKGSPLGGQSVALIFEKPSLRTRVSFEVGLFRLGAQAVYLDQSASPIGQRESIEDLAGYLQRTVRAIVARVNSHATLRALADASGVPIINALSDLEHPCQALADLVTIQEHIGKLEGARLAYVGDGNNVCHSLMLAGAIVGMHVTVVTPAGRGPRDEVVTAAEQFAKEAGVKIQITTDPAAVADHDVVYTDTWESMGEPVLTPEKAKAFEPYRVTRKMMENAGGDAAGSPIFMHCMPAHRGEEVDAEVIDGPGSVVYDQAENRLYAQNALMLALIGPQSAAAEG